jgi:hypothetical protein
MKTKSILLTGILITISLSFGYSHCQTTHTNGYCDYQTGPNGGTIKTCIEKPSETTNGRCLLKTDDETLPGLG